MQIVSMKSRALQSIHAAVTRRCAASVIAACLWLTLLVASAVAAPKPRLVRAADTSPSAQQLLEIADAQARQAASLSAIMARLDTLSAARMAPQAADPIDATLKRLQAENLAELTKKTRTEERVAYLAPLATAISVLLGFAGIFIQQSLTARANLTVKALELVMSADTPFVAQGRYDLLRHMFGRSPPAPFQGAFDPMRFPGLRLYAMAMELFKAVAAKCQNEAEVRMVFDAIFSDWEAKWQPNWPRSAAARPPSPY